ncbi:hypothetical protein GGI12_003372 [Dipsacomyces acuminosporus]|nr:hypothetical protein GGI12_003372 [Dipsacomyces acuminosporus]
MANLSPAQRLPIEVLEEIVYHATGLKKFRRAKNSDYDCNLCLELMPFLGVCSQWRLAAMSIFYMSMYLTTDEEVVNMYRSHRFLHSIDDIIASKAERFVRHVDIQISLASILSGKMLTLLSLSRYASAAFPSVFHLTFRVYGGGTTPRGEESQLRDNAVRGCERIKELFPSTRSIYCSTKNIGSQQYLHIMGDAVACLTRIQLAAFSYAGRESHIRPQELSHLANLTHVVLYDQYKHRDIIELVRQNSSTLVNAKLTGIDVGSFVDLIKGTGCSTIAYPRLRKLYVSAIDTGFFDTRVSLDGVPFPALTHLDCAWEYPFNNDILFRGNNETLESLRFFASAAIARIITKSNLFKQGRYPNLGRMTLIAEDDPSWDNELERKFARIPFEIGPQMKVVSLEFRGSDNDSVIMGAIRNSISPQSIRFLSMEYFRLTVSEAVEVLEKLPNLRHVCLSLFEEKDLDYTDQRPPPPSPGLSLLPKLHSEHFPASEHLRSIRFESRTRPVSRQAVADILMIASLAPNLQYITGFWLSLLDGKRFVREVASDPALAPYAGHLRSLKYLAEVDRFGEKVDIF